MTTIRATCPDCGDIKTHAGNLVLRFLKDTDFVQAEYRFVCPGCNKIVVKPASKEIANVLYQSGVAVETYDMPIELLERPVDAPIISLDDILDLGLAMQNEEEMWKQLLGGGDDGVQ